MLKCSFKYFLFNLIIIYGVSFPNSVYIVKHREIFPILGIGKCSQSEEKKKTGSLLIIGTSATL